MSYINKNQLQADLLNLETTLINTIAPSIRRIVETSIKTSTVEKVSKSNKPFLFSAVLRPFLFTTWNAAWSLGEKHAGIEINRMHKHRQPVFATFAADDDEIIKQQQQLLTNLRKDRVNTIEEQLKQMGFNNLAEAEALAYGYTQKRNKGRIRDLLRSRNIDPTIMNQVEDLTTEARGLKLDIKDATTVANSNNKLTTGNNNPSTTTAPDTEEVTETMKESPQARNRRMGQIKAGTVQKRLKDLLTKKGTATTDKENEALKIRETKLRQELISAEIQKDTAIDLSKTDYANAYLNSRTQQLSASLDAQFNAVYKRKIAEYITSVQNKGQKSLSQEQRLLEELSGKQSNRRIVNRINELLKSNNVPSIRAGGKISASKEDTQEEADQLQTELDGYESSLEILKEDLGYDKSDSISDIRQELQDTINSQEGRVNQLNLNERKRYYDNVDYLKQLNRIELNINEGRQQLADKLNLLRNSIQNRNLDQLIPLDATDKQLLNTERDSLTVGELDSIRSQAIQNNRIPISPALTRLISTEVNLAYNVGRMNRFEIEKNLNNQSKFCVKWINDLEGNTPCSFCSDRAGVVVETDQVSIQGNIKDSREFMIPAHPYCRCYWMPVPCSDSKEKTIGTTPLQSGSIVKWAVGVTATVGVIGAYLALQSLRRRNRNLADAIRDRVTKNNLLSLPLVEQIARPTAQTVAPTIKQEFKAKVAEVLPLEQIREIKNKNIYLLRETFETLSSITSLSQNARNTFEGLLRDLSEASSPEELMSVRDRANRFSEDLKAEIRKARNTRTSAAANLSTTSSTINEAKNNISRELLSNDNFAEVYNRYRREVNLPFTDIYTEIDEIDTLNNQGLSINEYIEQYDSSLSPTLADLNTLYENVNDIVYTANAQLPENLSQNFIIRRLDQISATTDSMVSSSRTPSLRKVANLQQELLVLNNQLNSLSVLRRTSTQTPSYEGYQKRIKEIANYIQDVKSRFPEDPNNLFDEIPMLASYLNDDGAYIRRIVAERNDKLRPAVDLYNSLTDLEKDLQRFVDAVESKPKLRTIDRLRSQGILLSREEYIAQITEEINQLKAIWKTKRTPEQQKRLDDLIKEQVFITRAEFRYKDLSKNMANFMLLYNKKRK